MTETGGCGSSTLWKRKMEGCVITVDLEREEEVYYGGQNIKGVLRIENKSDIRAAGKLKINAPLQIIVLNLIS